ncbi:MAG: MgtC/SapB family protein [Acidobacteria bacterium]|nr:MgtC/SapB family protein [Acidobacteriota bacterium]
MEISTAFQQLGIALGLGLLVGLQRESVSSKLGGLRTFPLITALGTICGFLAAGYGGWVVAVGFASITALIHSGKEAESEIGAPDPGLTTEVAMLVMFCVGAYLVMGHREVAIAIGGGTAVLLHYKGQLHSAMHKLSDVDLKAIMQFALISLVILPVLPNRTFGPYQVLNPRNIWLMVVLIVGIGLSGYIIYKFLGEKAGLILGGILGGLISSTATTVSFSRRSSADPESSRPAAIIILIASSVVFVRLLIEIGTVSPSFLKSATGPLGLMMAVLIISAFIIRFFDHSEIEKLPTQGNPTELKSALLFGLIYAAILLAVTIARDKFGSSGLYTVAAISGLTDVDAITLSTSQMVNLNIIPPENAWRVIVTATMSNLMFKSFMIILLGHSRLFYRTVTCLGLSFATGIALLLFWP